MSIRTAIKLAVAGRQLFCLPPGDGSELVRTIFASPEVYYDASPPFPENFTGYRLGEFRGNLDAFVKGGWISIASHPFNKGPMADIAPVDPVGLRIWDIRSLSPLPQIRCFGGWAEQDTFIALTWQWRDDIEDFEEEARECRRGWDKLFPGTEPFKAETIDGYIKKRYRVV
jgi:hypothetical protein